MLLINMRPRSTLWQVIIIGSAVLSVAFNIAWKLSINTIPARLYGVKKILVETIANLPTIFAFDKWRLLSIFESVKVFKTSKCAYGNQSKLRFVTNALRQTALKFRQVCPVFLVDSPQNRLRFREHFYPRPPKVDIRFPKLTSHRGLLRLHLQNMIIHKFGYRLFITNSKL